MLYLACTYFQFHTFVQELNDIRQSGIKLFRDIRVDESNILCWQGLIVPVSFKEIFSFVS